MPDIAKDKMEKVQQALNDYERSLGLLHMSNVDEAEINNYFNMSRDDIEKLSPLDCVGIALRLNQLSFFLQRQFNTEQSRVNWVENEINKYASDKVDNIGSQYTKYENRLWLLSKNDSYLEKLMSIRSYAKQRVERLTYLSSSIKNLADTFINCSRTKIAMRNTDGV